MQDNSKFMRRYSDGLKRQVIQELEEGASRGSLQRKYAIGGNDTINKWIRKAGKLHLLNFIVHVDIDNDNANEVKLKDIRDVVVQSGQFKYHRQMPGVAGR